MGILESFDPKEVDFSEDLLGRHRRSKTATLQLVLRSLRNIANPNKTQSNVNYFAMF